MENSWVNFSDGPPHMDVQVLDDQLILEPIYNSSVRINNIVKKTFWKRWMLETNNEKSGKSQLGVRQDEDCP